MGAVDSTQGAGYGDNVPYTPVVGLYPVTVAKLAEVVEKLTELF